MNHPYTACAEMVFQNQNRARYRGIAVGSLEVAVNKGLTTNVVYRAQIETR